MLRSKNQILWIVLIALSIALGFLLGNKTNTNIDKEIILIETEDNLIEVEEEGKLWITGEHDDIILSFNPVESFTFGDVGVLSWDNGIMRFKGDYDESAKIFFEEYLRYYFEDCVKFLMEKEVVIELISRESEQIMYRYVTSGEWAETFKPEWFLEVINTDMSKCLINDRLRINLNGKIYWIRLEEDKACPDISEYIWIFGNVTKVKWDE